MTVTNSTQNSSEELFVDGNNVEYGINPLSHNDTFRRPWETSLLKTLWEKEKLLVTSDFSFSQSFLPVWITFFHFHQI